MGKVFFPLDEELGLLPGNLAPRQQEHLVHLACFMPFDKVVQMMEEMVSVQTHQDTVRRLTEQVGSWMEATQTAEVEGNDEPEPEHAQALQRCVISADGAMISLVHKQWVETRTVAIGEPQEKRNAQGETEIHVGDLSYFSRLADAFTFTKLAEVETRRRKVAQAKEVCAVMDGADWLQFFVDKHRPDALRILDFPHAAEHITKLLEALENAGMRFPPRMLDRCLHLLKHRGPRPLLSMADRLERDLAQQKGVEAHLGYLQKREALMRYPLFRQQGWPIGSGMVESANKNVVEARLKGTGMHWERKNVNSMLALRNAVCNDRWREMWQRALLYHRNLQALQRSARTEQRARAFLAVGNSSSQESPCQPASQEISVPVPSATLPSTSGSCAHHTTGFARVNRSCQRSSGESRDPCLCCGTPLIESGGRRRRYCSDRCRVRAFYRRQANARPLTASLAPVLHGVNASPQRSSGVNEETCLCCGTPLVLSRNRRRRYCSDRCRARAYQQRQANANPPSPGVKASPTTSREARRDTCLCCGTAIGQGRRGKRYCSDRCRGRAYYQRQVPHAVNVSPARPSEVCQEACLCCGAAIGQGRRGKRYCSDRCRVRSFQLRQADARSLTAPLAPVSHAVKASPTRSSEVSQEVCLRCGTAIVQSRSRTKRYCSNRCRVRAFQLRQAKML